MDLEDRERCPDGQHRVAYRQPLTLPETGAQTSNFGLGPEQWLDSVVRGFVAYHAIPSNSHAPSVFHQGNRVKKSSTNP